MVPQGHLAGLSCGCHMPCPWHPSLWDFLYTLLLLCPLGHICCHWTLNPVTGDPSQVCWVLLGSDRALLRYWLNLPGFPVPLSSQQLNDSQVLQGS